MLLLEGSLVCSVTGLGRWVDLVVGWERTIGRADEDGWAVLEFCFGAWFGP